MNIAEKLTQIAENEQKVFEAGRKDYHNEFWDNILSGTNWQYKFCGSSWNDKTFYPPTDLICGQSANHLFYLCGITDLAGRLRECGVKLDLSKASVRVDNMFNYATKLTTVPYLDVRNCNRDGVLNGMFSYCTALKTIEGIHLAEDGSQTLGSSIFTNCSALENITFYGAIGSNLGFQQSTKLSGASIRNIIEHLSDAAEGKRLSIPQVAANAAFTTDEWNALIATKPNWTFALST